jgi:CRP/FNR family transcriptional regulator
MPCRNCDCPFNENRAEIRQSSADQPRCLVADAAQKVSFEQGDIVFMQGQKSSSLYSLTEGMIKICSHTADGREQIVGLSTPGNMLVGLQSLNDERYAYTGIAATAVQACKIRHKTLLALIKEHGEIAMRLIIALNAQLAHSRALMEVMGHKCAAAKIASFILLMSPKSVIGNCHFAFPISRMEMAGLLGLSEETVCRLMANMKRAGAIYAPRGNIEIRNWDRLHAIADDTADGIRVA